MLQNTRIKLARQDIELLVWKYMKNVPEVNFNKYLKMHQMDIIFFPKVTCDNTSKIKMHQTGYQFFNDKKYRK